MIAEVGHFSLIVAMVVSFIQGTLPLIGDFQNQKGSRGLELTKIAVPAAKIQFFLILAAFLCLMISFITSDFSLLLVANHSNTQLPFIYKISATWANHEGSMVLWVFVLSIFGYLASLFKEDIPENFQYRSLAIQGLISFGFLFFIVLTSNPFERLFPPGIEGRDLNPLLQDPALAYHPPFLYLGYVGFSMTFSFSIAALLSEKIDQVWAKWVKPWALIAWSFLTIGIAMGSWWAYYELGWGGVWFWDPVENSALIPWLAGTALIHSLVVLEKTNHFQSWTILLSILTFAFSLTGTFLVRSGILSSIHTFANDPKRGIYILILILIAIGSSLILYSRKIPKITTKTTFEALSREGALLFNNILMTTAACTVFLGTLYPLVLDVIGVGKISVGAPFFNKTFIPLAILAAITMAIAPLLSWKKNTDLLKIFLRLRFIFLFSLLLAISSWYIANGGPILALISIFSGLWLFFATIFSFLDRIKFSKLKFQNCLTRAKNLAIAKYGMTFAHIGIAFVILGVTGNSVWKIEKIQYQRIGEKIPLANYEVTLKDVRKLNEKNYQTIKADFIVTKKQKTIKKLTPEKRFYPVRKDVTTEADIFSSFFGDLYAVIGDPHQTEKNTWITRLFYNPLTSWIWLGSVLMFLGGLISIVEKKSKNKN